MFGREPISSVSRAVLNFLSILLIVFTVPAIFVLPAEGVLFQPSSYARALDNLNFYDRFPSLLAQALIEAHALPAAPGLGQNSISYLTQEDYTRFFAMLFPKDWLRAQSESVLQNFGDFINFRRNDLTLPVDLRPVKERLSGDVGRQIADRMINTWPDCSLEDAGKIVGLMLSGQLQGIPICRPPQMAQPAFTALVQGSLQTLGSGLPDQFDLAGPLTSDQPQPGINQVIVPGWWTAFRWYTILRWLFRLTPVFALAVLLWMILLTVRSLPDLLAGTGQPLLTAGMVAFVLALLIGLVLNPILARVISNALTLVPAAFRGVLVGVFMDVGTRFAIWSAFSALVVTVVGVILLFSPRFLE